MSQRAPASVRTRQSLSDLIEGRLSSPDDRAELVKLTTRLIVEKMLEAESREVLGREYYEHGVAPGQGYRNGNRTGHLKTSEGLIACSALQIAGRDEPIRSEIWEHLKGRTQALEDLAVELLARGLSVRDIEDAFRDKTGRLLLSGVVADFEADFNFERRQMQAVRQKLDQEYEARNGLVPKPSADADHAKLSSKPST